MVSMNDVSLRAGVSKATVSRVLNGTGEVSAPIRSRVLSACDELNYRINANIQDLILKSRNGAARNIALVLAAREFSDKAYSYLVDEASLLFNEKHYQLMLVRLTGEEKSVYDLPPVLRDGRVDGVLLSGALTQEISSVFRKLALPCVILGRYAPEVTAGFSCVHGEISFRHFPVISELKKRGAVRIAYTARDSGSYAQHYRLECFQAALRQEELPFHPELCFYGEPLFPAMKEIFSLPELPFDAVLCFGYQSSAELTALLLGYYGFNRPVRPVIVNCGWGESISPLVPYLKMNITAPEKSGKVISTAFDQLAGLIDHTADARTIIV